MKLNVQVTEDDIRLGRNTKPVCEFCPIARAIKRVIGKTVIVNGRKWAIYSRNPNWEWNDLPGIAIHFIMQFDRNSRVNPINFEIEME